MEATVKHTRIRAMSSMSVLRMSGQGVVYTILISLSLILSRYISHMHVIIMIYSSA